MLKKILIIIVVVIIIIALIGIVAASASGFIHIPLVNSLLGTDKPKDLGIKVDPETFDASLARYSITLGSDQAKLCFACRVAYSDYKKVDITMDSSEVSSYLSALNQAGPLTNIQLKLGDNGAATMSAWVDLKKYGYNYSGPVLVSGVISRSGNSLDIDVSQAKLGMLGVPEKYIEQGEKELQKIVNQQLGNMTDLKIDDFSIDNGKINFKGNFPTHISSY